eukprot:3301759-Rhodomonas_salina.1
MAQQRRSPRSRRTQPESRAMSGGNGSDLRGETRGKDAGMRRKRPAQRPRLCPPGPCRKQPRSTARRR